MISPLREFGKELRKLINSDKVLELLEGTAESWGYGGCWILAAAVAEHLGPPAELMVVQNLKDGIPTDHVVVKYVDLYIDHNGTQTRRELAKNLVEMGSGNRLVPFTKKLQKIAYEEFGIPWVPEIIDQLTSVLNKRFGS